jgi:hypothetical protein
VVAVLPIDRNRRFLTGEPGSEELNDAVPTIAEPDEVDEARGVE